MRTFCVPGIIFFPGFPLSTSVRYTLIGILELFSAKNRSTLVTNNPPSNPSTVNVCASGLGLDGLSVLLSTICVPSLDLKKAGEVETIEDGFSGIIPVA